MSVAAGRPGVLRRLYDWVIGWAGSRWAVPALALLAFSEASFFPIPPDVLLLAMALARPRRALHYAAVCTLASVAGGVLGYGIGAGLMDAVGCALVKAYSGEAVFDLLAARFTQHDFWAVFVAAVTPIPYKIFTITAGAVGSDFWTFLTASLLGRPVRFLALALLVYFVGPPVKRFIDRYFNLLSVAFVVLLLGGFALVKGLRGGADEGGPAAADSAYLRMCGGQGE
ncbi:MAG: DedA family protein [Deltaproteobacteria bacterium]|nr:MAG: DedA family protein [Deltaproteobacteria bacterium]